jgi:probable F420-dependent oxidoreductase
MAFELGSIGVMSGEISHGDRPAALEAAAEVEELGYSTIWLPGSQTNNLPRIADVVRATRTVHVGSAIIPVIVVPAEDVATAIADLEATDPGRFIVGLGGAHGPNPIGTLNAYLDRLDTEQPAVPADARVLAALGPRMLELARDRAAGAFPILVTPEWVADARARLGPGRKLIVALMVVVEPDAAKARARAWVPVGFLKNVPAYAANFRRMGFTDDDIEHSSDRLIDAVTAWGDVKAIAARVRDLQAAGADQVALNVISDSDDSPPLQVWRQLADAIIR